MFVILLQQGKGGDIASAFGGGSSQAAFGARSGATVLSRATTVCALLFVVGAIAARHSRTARSGICRWRPLATAAGISARCSGTSGTGTGCSRTGTGEVARS